MKTFFYNLGYFIKEAFNTVRFNLLSNLISVIGTGLILFLLGLVVTVGTIGNRFIKVLSQEAEISVYYEQGTDADQLVSSIKALDGVMEARLVSESEAEDRMKEMLGEESDILELFDQNPFEAFIEVRINLESMDLVLAEIGRLDNISYVRDNRSVLEQLQGIINGLKILGYLIIIAVGVTTLIIISHMIRQGIYNNRDHINTLRLLGAPGAFIGFPFLLTGLFLTLFGGGLAMGLLIPLIRRGYNMLGGSLPFIPLPSENKLMNNVLLLILVGSVFLGLTGSIFGLFSIRKVDNKG